MKLSLVPRREDTIEGAGEDLRAGRITCVGLVERCLAAIEEWEPKVHAWAYVDRNGALDQAARLDRELVNGRDRGVLHGIPMGVKDIFDVAGMPTRAGCKRWSEGNAARDTDVVETYRQLGAVFLGKTVTTPYAFLDPPPTRNPWDLSRTPGGSSSGSAVAVATGMCLCALGSQTAGSLTRPAAFCGVASSKPSSPWSEPVDGIVPLAPSLDSIGIMARTVADIDQMNWALFNLTLEASDKMEPIRLPAPPRLLRLREFFDRRADLCMTAALDRAVRVWRKAGAEVIDVPCPPFIEQSLTAVRTIMAVEVASLHRDRMARDPEDYPPRIASLVHEGMTISGVDYVNATYFGDRGRSIRERGFSNDWDARADAIIVPAALGPAPGPETTGDSAFNAPWNYLNLETLSFPIELSPEGLPLAVQFVAQPQMLAYVSAAAVWCEHVLHSSSPSERD
jgi:Asp-tRNA(Asn)/Glu-tRNA(Gln) amidotransferase A subunit family amidase